MLQTRPRPQRRRRLYIHGVLPAHACLGQTNVFAGVLVLHVAQTFELLDGDDRVAPGTGGISFRVLVRTQKGEEKGNEDEKKKNALKQD